MSGTKLKWEKGRETFRFAEDVEGEKKWWRNWFLKKAKWHPNYVVDTNVLKSIEEKVEEIWYHE